ncbi:MAG TPA: hypothetical protein VIM98_17740 [Dyella sp.]|uniref:hypothetical protein n=1 Tax=Dyella sp. TaxID=1869338 RepID=UPI002F927505
MIKGFITGIALATGFAADAQILQQRAADIPGRHDLIERQVKVPDAKGRDTVVTQVLRPNSDGTFTYLHDLQPPQTKDFDRRLCSDLGGKAKLEGESIWGAETLAGIFCEWPNGQAPKAGIMANGLWLEPEGSREDQSRILRVDPDSFTGQLVILQAYAPKNFVVPSQVNYLYQGHAQIITNTAGVASSQLQIGNGCRAGKQDWIPANTNGQVGAAILCHAHGVTSINTSMTTC